MVQPSPSWWLSTRVILIFLQFETNFSTNKMTKSVFKCKIAQLLIFPLWNQLSLAVSFFNCINKKDLACCIKSLFPNTVMSDEPKLPFLEFCLCFIETSLKKKIQVPSTVHHDCLCKYIGFIVCLSPWNLFTFHICLVFTYHHCLHFITVFINTILRVGQLWYFF